MRIALISEHADPLATLGGVDAGGQNVHVAALAAGLSRSGHDVTVFTRRDDPTQPAVVTAPEGYQVEHVPAGPPSDVPKDELLPYMRAFADYLTDRWALQRPDIAHAHFWMSGLAATAAGGRLGVPVVQTFHALGTVKRRHQGKHDTSPDKRVGIERRLARGVDRVIATCRDEVGELTALGLDPARADVIPCGVDVRLFRPAPRSREYVDGPDESGERPSGSRRLRLLSIGRLVERKGVADVVAALAELPDVELVVAGGPKPDAIEADPEVRRLRAQAERFGVADRVRFLGGVAREQVPALMHAADVVVTVPWYEPFGIVPVEAMACGRPVVGSAVGGLCDTILPGVTGELVPPRKPAVLARALGELLADPARRSAYGAAGRRRAITTYRWEQVVGATEAVYRSVVEEQPELSWQEAAT